MFKERDTEDRTTSLDVLQDFEINTADDWANWEFNYEEMKDIPISLTNKYNFYKNVKYCDISSTVKHQQADFLTVEAIARKKNKQYISKNARVTEKRVQGNPTTKQYTKKVQKFWRPWTNQNKTNFKKITVKNDWKQIKTINKNILEGLPKSTTCKIEQLKKVGTVNTINPNINRISWTPIRFKENQQYEVKPVATHKDKSLTTIAQYIYNQEQTNKQFNIICAPEFLVALLTLRGSVYPWNIQIVKEGKIIILESYRSPDQEKDLTYLDLFVANENTTNHMPLDENKVKENCINATKLTKIFKDLLASGEPAEIDLGEESEIFKKDEQDEDEEQEDDEESEEEKLECLRKYLRVTVGNFDVFTYVDIDGVKQTEEEYEKYLIRTFMESQTQGAWMKQMKTSPGSIITKEYHANNCSIQKWICQARLAGVENIKLGYMGYEQNKPVLLNVSEVTVEGLQKTFSFKFESCWSILNYVIDLVSKQEDGTYVLSKAPYTPLSIKLYQIAVKKDDQDDEDEEEDNEQN